MGLFRNEAERFGMLDAQAWRAARLVVDTGIHAKHWTREQGVAQMLAAGLSDTDANIETNRYITLAGPGPDLQGRPARDRAAARRDRHSATARGSTCGHSTTP